MSAILFAFSSGYFQKRNVCCQVVRSLHTSKQLVFTKSQHSTSLSSLLKHISLWQNLNHILSNQGDKVQDLRKRKHLKGKTQEGEIRLGAAVIFA